VKALILWSCERLTEKETDVCLYHLLPRSSTRRDSYQHRLLSRAFGHLTIDAQTMWPWYEDIRGVSGPLCPLALLSQRRLPRCTRS